MREQCGFVLPQGRWNGAGMAFEQQRRGAGLAVAIRLAAVAAEAQRPPVGDEVIEHGAEREIVAARIGRYAPPARGKNCSGACQLAVPA